MLTSKTSHTVRSTPKKNVRLKSAMGEKTSALVWFSTTVHFDIPKA